MRGVSVEQTPPYRAPQNWLLWWLIDRKLPVGILFFQRTEIGLCAIALPSLGSSIQILNQAADFHIAW